MWPFKMAVNPGGISGRDGYFASGVRVAFCPINDWRRLFSLSRLHLVDKGSEGVHTLGNTSALRSRSRRASSTPVSVSTHPSASLDTKPSDARALIARLTD
jgi:hypothetical protein